MWKSPSLILFTMRSWVIYLAVLEANALPTTTLPPTTHIVSFVHQRNTKQKSSEFHEFDFERFENSEAKSSSDIKQPPQAPTPLSQLYGRLIQQLDTSTNLAQQTDDLLSIQQNTLDDADNIFGNNDQHESSSKTDSELSTPYMWNRIKQSIPVLEPVKHLLNTVRSGAFNQTHHAARQHHQLINTMMGIGLSDPMLTPHQNESSAIETEEERETANESTEFQLLDFLGNIIGMAWGLLSNIQRIFAASSGNASAALSSSSSSSSSK